MTKHKTLKNEAFRLEVLSRYQLSRESEEDFENMVALATLLCKAQTGLVSILEEDHQWFKARRNMAAPGTSRDVAFCAHTIQTNDIMVVPDAQKDPRFQDNPLVTGEPFIRFYAGVPIKSKEGPPLGTLCVIDNYPRSLTDEQQRALYHLAKLTSVLFEQRRQYVELCDAVKHIKTLEGLLPICSYCKMIRKDDNSWTPIESFLAENSEASLTHGICESCFEKTVDL